MGIWDTGHPLTSQKPQSEGKGPISPQGHAPSELASSHWMIPRKGSIPAPQQHHRLPTPLSMYGPEDYLRSKWHIHKQHIIQFLCFEPLTSHIMLSVSPVHFSRGAISVDLHSCNQFVSLMSNAPLLSDLRLLYYVSLSLIYSSSFPSAHIFTLTHNSAF